MIKFNKVGLNIYLNFVSLKLFQVNCSHVWHHQIMDAINRIIDIVPLDSTKYSLRAW